MSHIKLIALPLQIRVGQKVLTGYRGALVAGTVAIVNYKKNRYVIEFKTGEFGHVVLCRKRHQIDRIDNAVVVNDVNEENSMAEEYAMIEMMLSDEYHMSTVERVAQGQ